MISSQVGKPQFLQTAFVPEMCVPELFCFGGGLGSEGVAVSVDSIWSWTELAGPCFLHVENPQFLETVFVLGM